MDKLIFHRVMLRRLLERHAELSRQAVGSVGETVLVIDESSNRYLLMDIGWDGSKRVNDIYLHVHLKGGKIWIEEDWTEEGLATELLREGIPREDIVLAFHSPERRHLTEFAVA
jgi:hypothetical protein